MEKSQILHPFVIVPPVLRIVRDIGTGKADTVLGMLKTGCFGTHVERKSGYLVAFRIDDRQDNAFNHATIKAFSSIPEKLKKSFTVDNGKEFAAHKALAEATGMKVFFCDPYSPDFATCSTNISTKKIKNLRKIWNFLLTNLF